MSEKKFLSMTVCSGAEIHVSTVTNQKPAQASDCVIEMHFGNAEEKISFNRKQAESFLNFLDDLLDTM